ncbi:MAG: glycoside hydrolase family 16 protein [Fimbriimonas sp.]
MIAMLACSVAFPAYQLVWSDEFSADGPPDPAKWSCEVGFVRNQELQFFLPDNVFVKNGLLVLEARKERLKNPNYLENVPDPTSPNAWMKTREYAEYTSGSVTTKGLASWKYGRIEVRAKIDTQNGLWPAIWTKGTERPWPDSGEVDLMEFQKGNLVRTNLIWGGGPAAIKTRIPLPELLKKDRNWGEKFHVWREDWDKDSISIYIDGVLQSRADLATTTNLDGINPFQQPHFLLMNFAIGSTGGDPSKSTFPAQFQVDYVRIYQQIAQ